MIPNFFLILFRFYRFRITINSAKKKKLKMHKMIVSVETNRVNPRNAVDTHIKVRFF